MPRDSIRSISRPALAKPDPQLALQHRRRAELRRHDEFDRGQEQVEVVADVLVDLLLAPPGRRSRPRGRSAAAASLQCADDRVDLGVGDERALHARRLGRTHRQEQRVALAEQLLRARLVEDDP